jgi:hypothetical protein
MKRSLHLKTIKGACRQPVPLLATSRIATSLCWQTRETARLQLEEQLDLLRYAKWRHGTH